MKKLLQLAIAFILPVTAFAQTVVEIPSGNTQGTGATATISRKPFGSYYGHERTEYLFSASEMNGAGTVGQIGFYVDNVSSPAATLPVKIYLKETTDLSLVSAVYDDEIIGATLVYDGTLTSADFNIGAWTQISLTNPFIYSGTNSLVVLVETNGGGSGTEGSSGKTFRYSTAIDVMQYWQADNSPPTSTGTIVAYRSNIQFTMAATTACNEPPAGGTALASLGLVCPNTNVSLSLSGAESGTGISYQWQSSADGLAWSDISSATGFGTSQSITSPIYFHCNITCGTTTVASDSVFVDLNAVIDCYCSSTATSAGDDDIGNVTFADINNGTATPSSNNAASANMYSDFSSITGNVFAGATYPISVSQINAGSFYSSLVNVYIDYNIDGTFDAGTELAFTAQTTTEGTAVTGSVTIPSGASIGLTKMRVVLDESDVADQCGTYTWGETEDYTINIAVAPNCTEPPVVGTLVATNDSACADEVVSFSLSGADFGLGITYVWETSNDNISWAADTSTMSMASISIDQDKYVRCIMTCGASSDTSNVIFVFVKPIAQCICNTGLHNNSCGTSVVNSITISGTSFATANNACALTGTPYAYNMPVGSLTASLMKGVSYPFNINTNEDDIISVWIDADNNGTLTAAEHTQICLTSTVDAVTTTNITIPLGAVSGDVLMRVRTRMTGNQNGPDDACLGFGSGETQDFIITLVEPSLCTGAPEAGSAVTLSTSVCDTATITINLNGNDIASGLHYQWQSSLNGTVWADLTNDTLTSLTVNPSGNIHYRCVVSCGSLADTSASVSLTETQCYCESNATSTADDDIGNVTFADINNGTATPALNNSASINTYTDFSSITGNVFTGVSYPISIAQINSGSFYSSLVNVYIDYNNDGTFDAGTELAFTAQTATAGTAVTGSVTIPTDATIGLTKMRVVLDESDVASPCGTYTWGETEDYTINIAVPAPCTEPPVVGTLIASSDSICGGEVVAFSLSGADYGLGLSYVWETSNDNVNWTVDASTTSMASITISQAKYVRCTMTCGTSSVSSNVVFVYVKPAAQCVCNTGLQGNACGTSVINSITISGTSFATANNACALTGTPYAFNMPVGSLTGSLIKGVSYPFNINTDEDNIISVWIDADNSGSLTAAEHTQIALTSTVNGVTTTNITVPLGAVSGEVLMRVRTRQTANANGPDDACLEFFSGETQDFMITLVDPVPCSGTPNAGTAVTMNSVVCDTALVTINLSGNDIASGLHYQWQVSTNGTVWADLTNDTLTSLTVNPTGSTYYRCVVSCGSLSGTSGAVSISETQCYCESSATSSADDDIGNVTFADINNGDPNPALNNTASFNTYTDFTSIVASVSAGMDYPISITQINSDIFYATNVNVYIDYNQDGTFDESTELVASGATVSTNNVIEDTIQIPITASNGLTRMRIVMSESATVTACGTYTYGETEDYSVMIGDANPCAAPADAGIAASNYSSVCSGEVAKISLTGASTGYDLLVQWQSSPDGSAWSDLVGATSKIYNVTVVTGEFFRCIISCGVSSDTSNIIYVGLKAANLCYCQSAAADSADDDIGNVTFNTINNGNPIPAVNNPLAYETYNNYTNISTNIYKTMSYQLSVTQINSGVHFPSNVHVYIDYNQNGSFDDAGELVMTGLTNNTFGGNVVDSNITIPPTALTGTTGMRVVLVETDTPTSCGAYGYGETEDYNVNIFSLSACTAPPLAGSATINKAYVCEGSSETLTLNLENYQAGTGQTYQWQMSYDNLNFSNIANATQPNISYLSDGTTVYFRCKVTCGGFDAFSSIAYVFAKPISQCYCDNVQLNVCDTTNGIDLVELVSTTFFCDDECANDGNAYNSYEETGSYTSTMYQGAFHLLNVVTKASYTIGVWVDFNLNGIFENAEYTLVTSASTIGGNNMKNIAVPMDASIGKTGFRVRAVPTALNMTADNACTYYDGGETKDFITEIKLYTGVKKTNGLIFNVYPNPAKTELNVVAELNSEGSIKLSMATGQVVFEEKVANTAIINKKINTAQLAPGIYMLEVTGNNQHHIEKVVIE